MLKRPPVSRQLWLQDEGPQKCTGLIFYKSYLACIKIATEFFIAHGEEAGGSASQTKIMQASCTDSSLRHLSPKFPAQKSHSISRELGNVAGGAYRNERFVGKERNLVRGGNRQG